MRLSHQIFLAVLALSAQAARADANTDLKAALARLQGTTALKASLETKTWHRNGEGKDAHETNGQASVQIEENARGMQLMYNPEMLARMEAEAQASARNPNAKTPTLNAAREFTPNGLRPMVFAAASLSRQLEKASFKSDKPDNWQGKPARLLTYELGIDVLSDSDRKYVKEFDGKLNVWTAADGTPLASRMTQNAHGRAFIVVSFDAQEEDDSVYAVMGERLVAVRKENRSSSAGMGERGEERVVKTLTMAN